VNSGSATAPKTIPVPQDQGKTIEVKGDKAMTNRNEAGKDKIIWTPEQKIQGFKELVTAILGLLILVCTLILAGLTFLYVGEPAKITDAKDILQVLLGVAGVVVGYYFGRVPADARAAQAQDQANAATAQTEQVNAKAQEVANQVEQLMDKTAPVGAASRGAGVQPLETSMVPDLQRIRDELRNLAAVSKRRG
jgi:hypothetical protein